jgi:hypothetical protein
MRRVQRYSLTLICLAALTLLLSNACLGARGSSYDPKEPHRWANIGTGGGTVRGGLGDSDGGISPGLTYSYQDGGNLYSLRFVGCFEFKLDLFGYTGPAESVWDLRGLYGRVVKGRYGLASISGGVAIVGFSDHLGVTSYRPGIPVEAQLFWTPFSLVGFGVSGFADWNSDKSFWGILFCLQIGKLRRCLTSRPLLVVIPAKAGIQSWISMQRCWIPAFAGMTREAGMTKDAVVFCAVGARAVANIRLRFDANIP